MVHQLPNDVIASCDGLVYCFMKWFYNVTNGFGPTGLLMAFCISLLMATVNRFGGARSFGFASVVGLLGAIFLATQKLMPWWIASIFILAGAAGFAVMIVNEK